MKDIILRKVESKDAQQYIKLVNYVWRVAYKNIFPEEVFVKKEEKAEAKIKDFDNYYYNNNKKITYVAEHNGKIVGIINGRIDSGYSYFNEKGFADLEALYIHPNYQGIGIASKLKNIFVNWAKENRATKFVIGVLKDNTNARKIYEKWGGVLDEYSQPFIQLGIGYQEVFYTYNLQ